MACSYGCRRWPDESTICCPERRQATRTDRRRDGALDDVTGFGGRRPLVQNVLDRRGNCGRHCGSCVRRREKNPATFTTMGGSRLKSNVQRTKSSQAIGSSTVLDASGGGIEKTGSMVTAMASADRFRKASPAPGVQWYYKFEDQACGPLTTDELIALVRSKKLLADDPIRLGIDGEWLLAGSIEDLFPPAAQSRNAPKEHHPEGALSKSIPIEHVQRAAAPLRTAHGKGGSAANAAANVLDHIHDGRIVTDGEELPSARRRDISRSITSLVATVTDAFKSAWEYFLEKLSTLLRPKIVLPILCVVLLAVIGWYAPWPQWGTSEDAYVTLIELRDEFHKLRDSKSDEPQWNDFSRRSAATLTPIVAQLEKTATVRDNRSMALLRAGRDFFPAMTQDARVAMSESEKKFEGQMAIVEHPTPAKQNDLSSTDSLTAVIIGTDCCIVAFFAAFILLRWARNRRSDKTT